MTKRRTKGDGGITQRKDGRWQATLRATDPTGRSVTTYYYGRTMAEARAKLNKAKGQKEAGTLIIGSTRTDAWLTYWLDNIAARRLKPQSLQAYRSRVDNYLIPHLGRHNLTDLRPNHVRSLHDWMEGNDKSSNTILAAHDALKTALRDAVREGKMSSNPADKAHVEPPKRGKTKPPSLTFAQARTVLDAAGDDPRWWLALFYGMRQGEALGLRWRDVDFDSRVLHIRETVQRDKGVLILGDPKSNTSTRTIPLLGQIGSRLRLHKPDDAKPDAFVFSGRDNDPLHPWVDWDGWRQLLVAATVIPYAPIPHVSLHSARQSAASLMEAAGIGDRVVMQILGHANVRETHGYQSSEIEQMRAGLEGVERMLELG